jgi:hypothetical protein
MDQADTQNATLISLLKKDVTRLGRATLNRLADDMRYVDLADPDHLSANDVKTLTEYFLQRGSPRPMETVRFISEDILANQPPGTNFIWYSLSNLRNAQMDAEVVLAHEFGHRAIDLGLITVAGNKEAAADSFAALVTSPQRVVDMLRNLARAFPENNQIPLATASDPHPTAYERALAVVCGFPGQANLENFPIPSAAPVTVKDSPDPVLLLPAPLPSELLEPRAELSVPNDRRPPRRANLRVLHATAHGSSGPGRRVVTRHRRSVDPSLV